MRVTLAFKRSAPATAPAIIATVVVRSGTAMDRGDRLADTGGGRHENDEHICGGVARMDSVVPATTTAIASRDVSMDSALVTRV
jgi:hypothetical protein